MTSMKIKEIMTPIIDWIYENTQHSSKRVQSVAASLLGNIASYCPDVLFKDENCLGNFYNWFSATIQGDSHPRIIVKSMKALQNFYVAVESRTEKSYMNSKFVEILNFSINKILDQNIINGGFSSSLQDGVNDITQYCDNTSLKGELSGLCDQILNLVEQNIIGPGTIYNEE